MVAGVCAAGDAYKLIWLYMLYESISMNLSWNLQFFFGDEFLGVNHSFANFSPPKQQNNWGL